MKKLFFVIVLLNCFIGQLADAGNPKGTSRFPNDTIWNLRMVYSTMKGEKQQILKLYNDKTYEYLVFMKHKDEISERGQSGTYKSIGSKIIFIKKNGSSKSFLPKFIFLKNNSEIYSSLFNLLTKKSKPILVKDTNVKYAQRTYTDSVFGKIINDKNAPKKITEPEWEKFSQWKKQNKIAKDKWDSILRKNFPFVIDTSNFKLSKNQFKKIKAVLIVGTDVFNGFKDFIEEFSEIAKTLRKLGIDVKEFYDSAAIWKDIVEASNGANILIYAGHGGDPDVFYKGNGSFSLAGDKPYSFCEIGHEKDTSIHVRSQIVISNLKLHKNALVIFNHPCFSAGSSSTDYEKELDLVSATKRVSKYAEPFVKLGIGGYYANNYSLSVMPFLEMFFSGYTLKDIYIKQAKDKIEFINQYQYDDRFQIGLTSRDGGGSHEVALYEISNDDKPKPKSIKRYPIFKKYCNAFVSKPDFTVMDFFK